MINRNIFNEIINIKHGQVTCIFGARRTGKTYLMQQIKNSLKNKKILMLHGEDLEVASILASRKIEQLKNLVQNYDFLFIDEAQDVPNIGLSLKLMVDTIPDIGIMVSGSASFDLKNKIGEPLTGRAKYFNLYPFSLSELEFDYLTALRSLPSLLIYGTYPQVFLAESEKEKRIEIENIKNGYLLKDILQLDNLKDSVFVLNLLKLIAFQIGNDISINELAINLHTTVKTIQRYIEILEKTYIIFRLPGFSRNLRKEISKSPRIYFWDNGIRNTIISNFNPPELRDDMGKLWENYCISEKLKKAAYEQSFSNFYFWRTYDQQEIDLIEEINTNLQAFEIKWGNKIVHCPKAFREAYPTATFQTINRENFFEFLM